MNQPKGHPLCMRAKKEIKDSAAGQLDALGWVHKQYNIAVTDNMAYVARNLQRMPQCDEAQSNKAHLDCVLKKTGAVFVNIGDSMSLTVADSPIRACHYNNYVVPSLKYTKMVDESWRSVFGYFARDRSCIKFEGKS